MERIMYGLILGILWTMLLLFFIGIAVLPAIQIDHQISLFNSRSFHLKKIEY